MSSRSSQSASGSALRGKLTKTKASITNKLLRRKTLVDKLLDDSAVRPLASLTFEHASSHADSRYATVPARLRKTRAYTSPFPMSTRAIDADPEDDLDDDLSNTVVLAPRSQFDYKLPREIKLTIFKTLLHLHEADHEERVRSGAWTVAKAGRERYVGREKGLKELFRLSRVSRSWQSLALDGQLWSKLDLHAFPQIPAASLSRLFRFAGPFIRQVDLRGHASLSVPTVRTLANSICLAQLGMTTPPISQLTELNLQGCKSIQSTVLHEIILKSPGLKRVSLKGLTAANNTTCVILASACSQLSALDVSRCRNLDASGIISIASAPRRAYSKLTELRLCGLKGADAALMTSLARGVPLLETLDLSYSSGLVDSDLDSFVAWREEWDRLGDTDYPLQKASLSAREMGYDPADQTRYFKRLTSLKHLNLSACRALTDESLGHLAHAVPILESLEIAGIGDELADEGVVRLLRTTPLIRRLDFEDASELSDAVLEVLTPAAEEPRSRRSVLAPPPLQPGHALEHLVLSSCTRITTSALLPLIRACMKLRVLELDGTRAGGAVVREFVRQVRRRGTAGAEVNASDCRGLPGESMVRELAPQTRRRRGWRAWDARRLRFVDPDECDESRVVFKSFWTWQAVDAERAARDKKLRAAIAARGGGDHEDDELAELLEAEELLYRYPADARAARSRWARTLGQLSPTSESCTIM
ncbi:RNI-like protein [Auricularia subglabra TFB-10046 SS5]|nr:RNI-like protein [Auricularia subglabra TFB-10046 SS5]